MSDHFRALRRLGAAFACLASLAVPATASAAATVDYSDLWFNPDEPGWGANIIQQDDVLFVTLFVYGTGTQPLWYVASSVARAGNTSNFSGTLYRTSGPYFGAGTFPSASVAVTAVGTLTFTASDSTSATLTYNVEGASSVTKTVMRQTWDTENITGIYLGATAGTWAGCGAARNGYQESPATFTIAHDGPTMQLREEGAGYVCNYTGTYTQSGRMGVIQGGGLCGDGVNQTFLARDVQVSPNGIVGRVEFAQAGGSCRFIGTLGAARRGS
ncbi:MAG TPA: hypothetical protein VEC19_05595 [Usitatibacter sp.]|nr:hypothetical protein [Usitatibacter sp.]